MSHIENAAIKRVVVVGRDVAAWMSALTLMRAFGPSGLQIEVVELPGLLRPHDTLSSLPALEALHRLLGFDEYELLKAVSGTYSLGQRFVNFSGLRQPFFHPYSGHGTQFSKLPFVQFYILARRAGLDVAFEDFSLGAAAAKQGRFFLPTHEMNIFNKCDYAYHFRAVPYVNYLRAQALRYGVKSMSARSISLNCNANTGYVDSVSLPDGTVVSGDLFIDATGPDGQLIGQAFDSWAGWFPDNRVLTTSAANLKSLPPYSQVTSLKNSVLHLTPLQDMTGLTHVYHGDDMRDEQALELAALISNLSPQSNATVDVLNVGRRADAWQGNVVAIGEAACVFNPIDNPGLHSIHLGLVHLISQFPVTRQCEIEKAEYNRVMKGAYEQIRDFQICHFKLNQNLDQPYWDGARGMSIPDSLAEKIDLFRARGRILSFDEETYEPDSWLSIFFGHGLMPESWDPAAARVPQDEVIRQFQRMLGFIREQVEPMNAHDAFIELYAMKDFA